MIFGEHQQDYYKANCNLNRLVCAMCYKNIMLTCLLEKSSVPVLGHANLK